MDKKLNSTSVQPTPSCLSNQEEVGHSLGDMTGPERTFRASLATPKNMLLCILVKSLCHLVKKRHKLTKILNIHEGHFTGAILRIEAYFGQKMG